MFGSFTAKDIAEGLAAQGVTVDRRKIQLAQPIKELGTVAVPIKMPRDVEATVKVHVVKKQEPEEASSPPASKDRPRISGCCVPCAASALLPRQISALIP